MITRRSKRKLKEGLELITYLVTSENGSERFEEFTHEGGPYRSLGELVDVEVEVRSYQSKDGRGQISLRSVQTAGEF